MFQVVCFLSFLYQWLIFYSSNDWRWINLHLIHLHPILNLAMSCLQELGNILSGSYLSSLSDFTQLNVYPSVPSLAIDMVGATISYGLIGIISSK